MLSESFGGEIIDALIFIAVFFGPQLPIAIETQKKNFLQTLITGRVDLQIVRQGPTKIYKKLTLYRKLEEKLKDYPILAEYNACSKYIG